MRAPVILPMLGGSLPMRHFAETFGGARDRSVGFTLVMAQDPCLSRGGLGAPDSSWMTLSLPSLSR